jgi:hypothetical protein
MKKYVLLLSFIFSLAWWPEANAQRFTTSKRYTSIGGSINAMNYFGDITPSSSFTSSDISFTRPNFGIHIMRRYTPRFSARVAFNAGRLQGDDFKSQDPGDEDARYRYLRNASFRNDIYEVSLVGIWDLFENRNTFLRRANFVPYFFAGVAGFYHNPRARKPDDLGGRWVSLQPLRTEGVSYSRLQVAIPAGVGFRYKVSPRSDISFEIGYRFTFFDYLDDVSTNYPDPSVLGGPESLAWRMSNRTLEAKSSKGETRDYQRILQDTGLSDVRVYYDRNNQPYNSVQGFEAGEKRGSSNERDWYLITGFHYSYILFKGVRCPKFR